MAKVLAVQSRGAEFRALISRKEPDLGRLRGGSVNSEPELGRQAYS